MSHLSLTVLIMVTSIGDSPAIRFEQVVERSFNGVLVHQAMRNETGEPVDFRCCYANQRAADWLGVSINELRKRTLNELYPDINVLFDQYNQVMRTGQSGRFIFDYQPVPGVPLQWFDAQVEPFEDGVICSFVDITDCKLAEQDRQSAHELIKGIFEASPWAIMYLTPVRSPVGEIVDFVFSLANKAAVAVGHRPLDALVGNRMLEMYPATHTLGLFDQYVRVYQTGEPFETEVFYNEAGIADWAHIMVVRQGDGLILTNSIITARKQAEAETIKNLTLLQQTEEVADTGSWEYNRTTGHLNWSPGMYRLFALPPGTAVKPDVYTHYATEQTRSVAQRLIAYLTEGDGSFEETVAIQTREGDKLLKIRANVIDNEANVPLRVLGIDKDTTVGVQTQIQLEQTALNLQAVLNASPASIAYLRAVRDPAGVVTDLRIVVANRRFAGMSGKSLSDLPGTSVYEINHVLWESRTWCELTRVLETGEIHYEEQAQTIGNETRWLALSVTRQEDGVVVTGLDITELRQMQQQQTDLLRQVGQSVDTVNQLAHLQQQIRKRGDLLRTSSHDLRASLGIVQSAAGLLTFAHTDEDRAHMLDIIQRNVKETTRLITDLLNYARLEAGQEVLQMAQFDAGQLLLQLGRNIEPIVQNKGLAFQLEGPETLPLVGDAVQVLRIAQNLVLNALKYTRTGSITLRWATETPEKWSFSVIDTGPGLPTGPAHQPVRDPIDAGPALSHSLPNGSRLLLSSVPGEGIGLHIAQQLTELMGGRMVVKSGPGGSTFLVSLPRYY